MRVLVTGGAGFIGSNLARTLSEQHQVVVADDFQSASWKNLVDFRGDVVTVDLAGDLRPLLKLGRFDVIFHQASITDTTVHDQRRMMHNNHEAFRQVLDWASDTEARVVWASSCSIYGRRPAPMRESQAPDPLNVYAFSKMSMERLAEQYARRGGKPIVALRYSNVYGPGEDHKGKFASMIHQLARQMRDGQRPRIFYAGEQARDFVYIDDVMQANLKAMTATRSGVYNAGAGASWTFNEVVRQLNRVLGTKLEPQYIDNPYGFTQDLTQTDLSLSSEHLGYQPKLDLQRGIDAYHASGKLGVAL